MARVDSSKSEADIANPTVNSTLDSTTGAKHCVSLSDPIGLSMEVVGQLYIAPAWHQNPAGHAKHCAREEPTNTPGAIEAPIMHAMRSFACMTVFVGFTERGRTATIRFTLVVDRL